MSGKQVTAVLAAALLLFAAVGGVASAVTAGGSGDVVASHNDENSDGWDLNETEPADSAYVTDGGDVILVYDTNESEDEESGEFEEEEFEDDESNFENATGHMGLNVSAGLAHFKITGEGVETNTTANVTLWASPDEVAANGTLSTPKPDWLTDLDISVKSLRNDTVNRGSMDLSATMALEGDAKGLSFLQEAKTSGFVSTGPTSLDSNGSASVEMPLSMWPDRSHHIVLTEDDGSYTLSVEESYVLKSKYGIEEPTEGWESRAAAKQTLKEQYCAGTETTDVSCSVTLESYSLTEGDQPRLDLSYTVTAEGVDSTISEAIVKGLTTPQMNTSEGQATKLANHVENVTLSRIEADLVVDGGDAGVTWNVSIDGKDDLTLAYAGVLEAIERSTMGESAGSAEMAMMGSPYGPFGPSPGELADRLRAQVAASKAADFTQTTRWSLSLTTGDETATLEGSYTKETTNWASYVDELQARDVNASGTSKLVLNASTVEDRVVFKGAASYEREDMFLRALEAYNETLSRYKEATGQDGDGPDIERVQAAIAAFEKANFTRGRLDYRIGQNSVTVEGAMAVENGTVLSNALPEPYSEIDEVYGSVENERFTVRMDDAVESDADEDDVRDLELVGEDTEVHLAGDWDADKRAFGSLNTTSVKNYLGLKTETASEGDDDRLPVVLLAGGGLALTAAAGGGIVLFRKWG